jgi:hypothetical protein
MSGLILFGYGGLPLSLTSMILMTITLLSSFGINDNNFNKHLKEITHTNISKISTLMLHYMIKTFKEGKIHHLRQYIKAKGKYFTYESITTDHQQMNLHAL